MNVVIVGGNINARLKKWLNQLGIYQFSHISVHIDNISPSDLYLHANRICNMITVNTLIITVGPAADRIMNTRFVLHGALPATTTKDEIKIRKSISQCREYLSMRSYYEHTTGPRIG